MENRGAPRFRVRAPLRRPNQRRQSAGPRDSPCAQGRGHRTAAEASTLLRSQTYIGVQYRRLRTKLGALKAITAMAHRLARLVYRMPKYGQQYIDKGQNTTSKGTANNGSRRKATQLGLQVAPTHV
jgi:transposase